MNEKDLAKFHEYERGERLAAAEESALNLANITYWISRFSSEGAK